MTKPVTVTFDAYPPGSEFWYVDGDMVRKVKVNSVQFTSHSENLIGSVRYHVIPLEKSGGPGQPRNLDFDLAVARELHGTEEAAKAALTVVQAEDE